ncbi:MAG: hypothetical protein JO348_08620 [Alphaproteobacteria bacterium]|nr:hypothetical protein [Alphaproteobacteria bacterium]MBV9419822.1 hypothetical protein [Alphaproteobacteria bacterium]MBV9541953.1 hypothetical protein [Alphaproteobacteria bacterium]MBV9903075.1 hypothetical protein [Alphaproteobacteria bacterium]
MRGILAAGTRRKARLVSALALVAGLGLAGCSDVDSALFGDEAGDTVGTASDQFPPATAPTGGTLAGTLPGTVGGAPTGSAPIVQITPVPIEAGANTGTAVSATIATLRSQVQTLSDHLAANAAQLATLRNAGADAAAAYHESKARITTRLQVGTTRGNPELVTEWNGAQASLDSLAGNINALNQLSASIAADSSSAHFALDQIQATYNVSGAVDEDHRQLAVLEDETNQTIVLIDRLLKAAAEDTQRQTAYVANERANLTTLAGAIKNGELYGADLGSVPIAMTAGGAPVTNLAMAGTPLVVIRFDRPGVDYQQILYAALSQALQARPSAAFSVVAVAPTRGTAAAVQLAQTSAKNHAQEVIRSMTDMGVPASRLQVASATDPGATSSEVRVFVR